MAAYVKRTHHVSLHVSNADKLTHDLIHKFKFRLFASRSTERSRQLAFRTGSAVFVLNERPKACEPGRSGAEAEAEARPNPEARQNQEGCLYDLLPREHPVDTACNVCFEVDDVPAAFRALRRLGCSFPVPPTTVGDQRGRVTYAVLRSAVGNVCHTLIDKRDYSGSFLPGFVMTEGAPEQQQQQQQQQHRPGAVTHLDHITYACPIGSSQRVLSWYQQLFGFSRFFIHRNDDTDSGFVIHHHDVGLRLTAMEYLKCDESGLSLPGCKFVVAESLPGQGRNQVDTFLEEHHGAGIQHIGLYTGDIMAAVCDMAGGGARFFSPPPAYYTELGKLKEIEDAGQDAQKLALHGILLDADPQQRASSDSDTQRFLLQVFSKPIFAEDTFFLELIERRGSSGFGEGNIRALWKSVQAYMDGEKAQGDPQASLQQSP